MNSAEDGNGISALMAETTRAQIMTAASLPYDQAAFDSAYLGELGMLLNQEEVVNVFQSSRASHHKAKSLNFVPHQYVRIQEHRFSSQCRRMADSVLFQTLSVSLIVLQTIIVGVALDLEVPLWLESAVVFAFCGECLFIIAGYGKEWWRYFTGIRVGKWESQAKWNSFDFCISFGSLAMIRSSQGGTVAVLRLLRAVRILKQLLGKQPGFIVIMAGARKGLDSVIYICCLLLFSIFVYGVVGVALFSENNPSGFGGLSVAILSLYQPPLHPASSVMWFQFRFQCATLSNWQNLFYVQMAGCDKFDFFTQTDKLTIIETDFGWFFNFDCVNPNAQPKMALLFFVSFTLISSFVVLSLVVGTVTLGMVEAVSMVEDIVDIGEAHDRHRKRYTHTWMKQEAPRRVSKFLYGESEDTLMELERMEDEEEDLLLSEDSYIRILARNIALSSHAKAIGNETLSETIKRTSDFGGGRGVSNFINSMTEFSSEFFYDDEEKKPHLSCFKLWPQPFIDAYLYLAFRMSAIVLSRPFEYCMMGVVVFMALLLGVEASVPPSDIFPLLQNAIMWIFVLEVVMKLVSEGRAPQLYFYNAWNLFDFLVTVAALISLFEWGSFNVSIFRMFRLLQLMRSLGKMVTLRIIVECLTRAIRPMRYVAILFAVFNYLFSVLGVVLFKGNDPFHFGSLQRALVTLFTVETLQNWEKVMFLNMYGCENYNGQFEGAAKQRCHHSHGYGWWAAFYFIAVVIIGGILLPTMLIALITACMQIATEMVEMEIRTMKSMHQEISKYPDFYSPNRVRMLIDLFAHIDVDNSATLSFEEVYPLMKVVDDIFYEKPEAAEQLFLVVDADASGMIEMGEFMHLFRNINRASVKVREKTQNAHRYHLAKQDQQQEEVKQEDLGSQRLKRTSSVSNSVHEDKTALIPEEFRSELTKEASFELRGDDTSLVMDDDLLIVRELTARALARMMMGDPSSLKGVLNLDHKQGEDPDIQNRMAKFVSLFEKAAVRVHKPLILHRGDTLHRNLEDAVKLQVGLGVCDKRNLPYAMSLVASNTKIDGMRWQHGAVRSPFKVAQLAEKAEEKLKLLSDRLAEIQYLNKEAMRTGYQAMDLSGTSSALDHLGPTKVEHTKSEKEQLINKMMSEERKSMENLKKVLNWDGYEQWERQLSLSATHRKPATKREFKTQTTIEFSTLASFQLPCFANDEGGVLARRAGWCVLAGETSTRQFRRDMVSELCGSARRKVVKCLMEGTQSGQEVMDFAMIEALFKEMIMNSTDESAKLLAQDQTEELQVNHETFTHYLKVLMKERTEDDMLELTEEEIGAVLLFVDLDCDGVISFSEFQHFLNSAEDLLGILRELMDKFSLTPYGVADLKAAFLVFNTVGNGILSREEFHQGIRKLGCKVSKFEVSRLMASVGCDEKGFVDYDDFVCMFLDSRDLNAKIRIGLEQLAMYGAPTSYGGGSGVVLFHSVMDNLPLSPDDSEFIKSLMKSRKVNRRFQVSNMQREEDIDRDVIVSWAVLEHALLYKLPLGITPFDAKKILMLTDLTGSGHCSLRLFEDMFIKASSLITKLRHSFQERCKNPALAVHPLPKLHHVARQEDCLNDVPSLLLSENPGFLSPIENPDDLLSLSGSDAAGLLFIAESSPGCVNLPTLADIVCCVYDITAAIATARVLRYYRGYLDESPYPVDTVAQLISTLDLDLDCPLGDRRFNDLRTSLSSAFQHRQSDGIIPPRVFPAVMAEIVQTYQAHARQQYATNSGKRRHFGECSVEASLIFQCAIHNEPLTLPTTHSAVIDLVSPPNIAFSEHQVARLIAYLGDQEDGVGVSVERLMEWLEDVETITEKLLLQLEKSYQKYNAYVDMSDAAELKVHTDGMAAQASVTPQDNQLARQLVFLGRQGSAFKNSGNLDDAIRIYKEKLDMEPESQHGMTFYMIGEIFCKQGRWTEAQEMFVYAIKCDPHLEYEYEVQWAMDEIEAQQERMRKFDQELLGPLSPMYSKPKTAPWQLSNTYSMFGRLYKKARPHKTLPDVKVMSKEELQQVEEPVRRVFQTQRTVWSLKFSKSMQSAPASAQGFGKLPSLEEALQGGSLIFSPNLHGGVKLIVMDTTDAVSKVVGLVTGSDLAINRSSRHLGDTSTLVDFNMTFDGNRELRFRGYIDTGLEDVLEGDVLELADEFVVKEANEIATKKAAYSAALVYLQKGDSQHVSSIIEQDQALSLRLLAVKGLIMKREEAVRTWVEACLCGGPLVSSTTNLSGSAPPWGGEDLLEDVTLPDQFNENPTLKLKVMCRSRRKKRDICMGEVVIGLTELTPNLRLDKWFPLHPPIISAEDAEEFKAQDMATEKEERTKDELEYKQDDEQISQPQEEHTSEHQFGELRVVIHKGDSLKKTSNDIKDELSGTESSASTLSATRTRHVDKKYGKSKDVIRIGDASYLRLGTFFAEKAQFAFHSDDRYGVHRAPLVLRAQAHRMSSRMSAPQQTMMLPRLPSPLSATTPSPPAAQPRPTSPTPPINSIPLPVHTPDLLLSTTPKGPPPSSLLEMTPLPQPIAQLDSSASMPIIQGEKQMIELPELTPQLTTSSSKTSFVPKPGGSRRMSPSLLSMARSRSPMNSWTDNSNVVADTSSDNADGLSASRMALLVRFLGKLSVDRGAMHDLLNTLPEDVRSFVHSTEFTEGCYRKFEALCRAGEKAIPIESMTPILNQFAEGQLLGQTSDLCGRFMRVFDEDRDGFINSSEFLDINRFFFMVSCLNVEHNWGQNGGSEELRNVRRSYEEIILGPYSRNLEDLDVVLLTATEAHGFHHLGSTEPEDIDLPTSSNTTVPNINYTTGNVEQQPNRQRSHSDTSAFLQPSSFSNQHHHHNYTSHNVNDNRSSALMDGVLEHNIIPHHYDPIAPESLSPQRFFANETSGGSNQLL